MCVIVFTIQFFFAVFGFVSFLPILFVIGFGFVLFSIRLIFSVSLMQRNAHVCGFGLGCYSFSHLFCTNCFTQAKCKYYFAPNDMTMLEVILQKEGTTLTTCLSILETILVECLYSEKQQKSFAEKKNGAHFVC